MRRTTTAPRRRSVPSRSPITRRPSQCAARPDLPLAPLRLTAPRWDNFLERLAVARSQPALRPVGPPRPADYLRLGSGRSAAVTLVPAALGLRPQERNHNTEHRKDRRDDDPSDYQSAHSSHATRVIATLVTDHDSGRTDRRLGGRSGARWARHDGAWFTSRVRFARSGSPTARVRHPPGAT